MKTRIVNWSHRCKPNKHHLRRLWVWVEGIRLGDLGLVWGGLKRLRMSTDSDLQAWPEVPSIAHFCSLFRWAINLTSWQCTICVLLEKSRENLIQPFHALCCEFLTQNWQVSFPNEGFLFSVAIQMSQLGGFHFPCLIDRHMFTFMWHVGWTKFIQIPFCQIWVLVGTGPGLK